MLRGRTAYLIREETLMSASTIELQMSNDGRVRCAVHARREPGTQWDTLATVVAADGGHECEVCGARVGDDEPAAGAVEADLWIGTYDAAFACTTHLPAPLRQELAAGARSPLSYIDEGSGRERFWYSVHAIDEPGAEMVLKCEQCCAPERVSAGERWWRIPFPQDWVETVRPYIVATRMQQYRWHGNESAMWGDWLSDCEQDFFVDDGILRFSSGELGVFGADLVESPGMGIWVRLLTLAKRDSGKPGVWFWTAPVSVPAPAGLDDPLTLLRTLLLQLAPMDFAGATSDEAPGPAGDALLQCNVDRWDVHDAAGIVLAEDVDSGTAVAMLRTAAGDSGLVEATAPTMRALTWPRRRMADLAAYARPAAALG